MQNVTTKVQDQLLSTTSYYEMLHCEQSLIHQFCLYSFSLKRFSIWLKLCQLEPNQKPWPWTDMDWWWPGSLPPAVPLKFLEKNVTDVTPLGWTVINEVLKCASQQIFRVSLMKYVQSLIITYFCFSACVVYYLLSFLSSPLWPGNQSQCTVIKDISFLGSVKEELGVKMHRLILHRSLLTKT